MTLGMTQQWVSNKTEEILEARKEVRREVVAELNKAGLSTREIGEVVNEEQRMVQRDLEEVAQNTKNSNLGQSDHETQDPAESKAAEAQSSPSQSEQASKDTTEPKAEIKTPADLVELIKTAQVQEALEKAETKHGITISPETAYLHREYRLSSPKFEQGGEGGYSTKASCSWNYTSRCR